MMKKEIEKYTYYTSDWDNYLKKLESKIQASPFLPKYHLYPKTGLMNDPNGLSYYNGVYHIFYQWFPFDSFHGMKHWGHATSTDLVTFDDKGIALVPDQEYEKNGAYSGNAFEHNDLLYLYYTANYKTDNGKIAKQALAIMDKNNTIKKCEENPIIDGAPQGFSQELRDPFVFEREGKFYMFLGGGRFLKEERNGFGDIGELLLYKSEDLIHWEYKGVIDLPIETGYMLECPSLVTIDGKDVLFLSPMGYTKEEYCYQNRFASIYLIGHLDLEHLSFDVEHVAELDAGFDYYAPQSFYGKNNLPLTFGWFGCGEQDYPKDEGWKHGLTTAQEMKISNGKFYRFPTVDLLNRFSKKRMIENQKIITENTYFHLQFETEKNTDLFVKFGNTTDYWQIIIDSTKEIFTVDRSGLNNEIDRTYGQLRSISMKELDKKIKIDVFVDNSFVELYINNGEKVFSFRIFLEVNPIQISFSRDIKSTLSYFE